MEGDASGRGARAHRSAADASEDEWLRRLLEASLEGIVVSVGGVIVDVNPSLLRMTGYTEDEVLGKSVWSFVPGPDEGEVRQRVVDEDESTYFAEIVRKDGERIQVEVRGLPIELDGRRARLATFRDVSALHRATRELARSEKRWRALLDQASDGIFVADESLRLIEVNAAACEMLGLTRGELLERTVPELGDPEDLAEQGLNLEAMQQGLVARTERKLLRKDGSTFYAAVSARFLPELGVYHAIARDVTARREAQDRLARSEARFRTMTEHLPDAVAVSRDGVIAYANPACVRLLGAQRLEDLLGRSPAELVHPEERREAARRIDDAAEGAAAFATDRRMMTLDGRVLLTRAVILPIVYDGGPALMSILHDVTEQRQLEAQLRRAQRMEAVGRMAGGIAHDFNNMLSVILSYADLGRREVPEGSPADAALLQITEAAHRSAALTRQLLSFSRHQVVEDDVVDPSEVVERLAELLRRTLGEDIRLRCVVESRGRCVRIPASQLEQVMVNLAVNARDAMPDGGELVITTRSVVSPDGRRWVEMSARDTGSGMTPEVVEHAFEPFYSTKPQAEGSGLGLSVVYGILTRTGGSVELDSTPGVGTTVSLRLPVVDASPSEDGAGGPVARPRGRGERVLVVEDEPAVQTAVVRTLCRHGYDARAATPEEALALAREERVDLLLTDVVMPGLDGRTLAEAVRRVSPGARVLFMSGYADDTVGDLGAASGFLPKPFTPEEILSAVRRALDAPPAG